MKEYLHAENNNRYVGLYLINYGAELVLVPTFRANCLYTVT